MLGKLGYDVTVFEKRAAVGGVWALAYPGVRLQNNDFHDHLSDLPWPTAPDPHPTGAQIRAYWAHAVDALRLDVRLDHEVIAALPTDAGWTVTTRHAGAEEVHAFDRLIIAIGQYTEGKHQPVLPGLERFGGEVRGVRLPRGGRGARPRRPRTASTGRAPHLTATPAPQPRADRADARAAPIPSP
ncbi:MAG: hypothetical protein ABMB14_23070, partial [Myxococcota bacterium]